LQDFTVNVLKSKPAPLPNLRGLGNVHKKLYSFMTISTIF